MADEERPRPSANMLEDISTFLKREGGAFGLAYDPDSEEWLVRMEWGNEATDSPMAAAAAYATHKVPAVAVELCLREAGI